MTDHDSNIVDIRNKIMRAINRSNPNPPLAGMIDTLLGEWADAMIDRIENKWKVAEMQRLRGEIGPLIHKQGDF